MPLSQAPVVDPEEVRAREREFDAAAGLTETQLANLGARIADDYRCVWCGECD